MRAPTGLSHISLGVDLYHCLGTSVHPRSLLLEGGEGFPCQVSICQMKDERHVPYEACTAEVCRMSWGLSKAQPVGFPDPPGHIHWELKVGQSGMSGNSRWWCCDTLFDQH